jgi:hypothetical protein
VRTAGKYAGKYENVAVMLEKRDARVAEYNAKLTRTPRSSKPAKKSSSVFE